METICFSTDMSLLHEEEFQSMKIFELRQALKARNLPITGTKAELINRLIEATSSSKDALLETDADSNEDEILDDDISPDSPTEELSLFADEQLSPEAPLLEIKAPRKRVAVTMGNGQGKKLCLNRATPMDVPPPSVEDVVAVYKETTLDAGDLTAKKIVFSDNKLTTREKLALRAERFNVKSSGTIKLKVADEGREKLPSPETKTPSFKPITFGSAPNLDKLKMRAERFGVVSSLLRKIEEKDRAKQRLVRFSASSTASSGINQALQKSLRSQKFGLL